MGMGDESTWVHHYLQKLQNLELPVKIISGPANGNADARMGMRTSHGERD